MVISIGSNIFDSPWGGGNKFALSLTKYFRLILKISLIIEHTFAKITPNKYVQKEIKVTENLKHYHM